MRCFSRTGKGIISIEVMDGNDFLPDRLNHYHPIDIDHMFLSMEAPLLSQSLVRKRNGYGVLPF
jgi:hypothetical protein